MEDEDDPVPVRAFLESFQRMDQERRSPDLLKLFGKGAPEAFSFASGDYEGETFHIPSDDEHRIPVGEEAILLLDRFPVGFHDQIISPEGRYHHQEG